MNNAEYNQILQRTEQQADLIRQQVKASCNDIHRHAMTASKAFYDGLVLKAPQWIQQAKCQNSVNNIFRVRNQAKAYTEELTEILSNHVKETTQLWVNERFIPLLKSEIETLAMTVNTQTEDCYTGLEKLRVTLDVNRRRIVDEATPSNTNRVLSTGASLLIGDLPGAIMGGAGGFDAMLKTLGCEFAAGIILGIVALFTPVGWTALIISAVLAAIAGGAWSLSSIESKIRKNVAEETVKLLKSDEQRESFNHLMTQQIDTALTPICECVEEKLEQLHITTNAYHKVS